MVEKTSDQTADLVDEEESYFVSMTDMMVGVIFIFIILLMVFALNFQRAALQEETLQTEINKSREVRQEILKGIERALRESGIRVDIDPNNGVLHLPEEILFPSGSATLTERGVQSLGFLATALATVIPCYSNSDTRAANDCERTLEAYLEVVAIEGHTDERPVGAASPFKDNWDLSVQRAVNTYREMLRLDSTLDMLTNPSGQKLFSVSGYGEFRPRARLHANISQEDVWQRNRRIDLRFVMREPRSEGARQTDAQDVADEVGVNQSGSADSAGELKDVDSAGE